MSWPDFPRLDYILIRHGVEPGASLIQDIDAWADFHRRRRDGGVWRCSNCPQWIAYTGPPDGLRVSGWEWRPVESCWHHCGEPAQLAPVSPPKDVVTVCQTLLDEQPHDYETNTIGDWGYCCDFCEGRAKTREEFQHEPACPCIAALRLLGGDRGTST